MVKVISDTSFLIHLATHRIKNIDSIETEIGTLSFIVPKIVKKELEHLAGDPNKKIISEQTLDFIKNFKTNDIDGNNADVAILDFIKENRSIVATMDKELKLSLIHISEPTRQEAISYAVFCLKKKI